uniref:EGF-like domain protein n=1 Tax=Bursaphelenchus xylophilus TaxID=6326 RepID=A0A1I7SRU5_BURXY
MFWLLLLLPSVIGASLCGECLNGGECLQNRTDPSQFYCRCPIGYFGEQCEVLDYCKNSGFTSPGINPCANGGECKNVTGGFECKCMDVFKGHRCEEDVDECENENVCLNDGVCENRHGSFRCICPNGLTGKHCEINIDDCAENPCQNGAKCIDGVDTFTCECPKGYIGQTCDRLDECFHNNPCVNGNCTLNSKGLPRCECGNEFTGDHCETDVDECLWNPCGGRGQCQNTLGSFKCHCFAGFEGERCDKDIDYCRVERCVNGGSCISQKHGYLCSCVVGFSGTHCEHRDDQNCKLPCENGGRCHNETHCECPNSFKGQFCEIEKPDPCGGNPCVNGGVCLNNRDYNDFVCRCPKGFSGKFCEFKNCNGDQECEMMPYHCNGEQCLNGGTCINLQTGFKCHCQDGFLGHRCELQNSTSVRITAGSEDSDKKGPVLVYLVGDSELVRRHVNEILHTMETSLQVEVKLAKDGDKKPMIYEWDSANGPGQRIDVDLKADSYSEKEMEQGGFWSQEENHAPIGQPPSETGPRALVDALPVLGALHPTATGQPVPSTAHFLASQAAELVPAGPGPNLLRLQPKTLLQLPLHEQLQLQQPVRLAGQLHAAPAPPFRPLHPEEVDPNRPLYDLKPRVPPTCKCDV